jgi:hypothetical protein
MRNLILNIKIPKIKINYNTILIYNLEKLKKIKKKIYFINKIQFLNIILQILFKKFNNLNKLYFKTKLKLILS